LLKAIKTLFSSGNFLCGEAKGLLKISTESQGDSDFQPVVRRNGLPDIMIEPWEI
jgi:hypothetical protein